MHQSGDLEDYPLSQISISETCYESEDLARLRRAERMMVQRMCGLSLKGRKCSDELLGRRKRMIGWRNAQG